MNTAELIIATTALALALAGAAAHAATKGQTRQEKNEARLEKLLEGRTAGEPLSCIPLVKTNRLEVIDGVALVYHFGDTLYVSRPTHPEALRFNDVLVMDLFGSQLCNTDMIHTVDRSGGFFTGVVSLKQFVPYKKQD